MTNMPAPTLDVTVPQERPCTRCGGTQYLVAAEAGLGKYRCDSCEMVVGFDLEAVPAEFLLHRGLARRYTKQWFGPRLSPQEQRLASDANGGATTSDMGHMPTS